MEFNRIPSYAKEKYETEFDYNTVFVCICNKFYLFSFYLLENALFCYIIVQKSKKT